MKDTEDNFGEHFAQFLGVFCVLVVMSEIFIGLGNVYSWWAGLSDKPAWVQAIGSIFAVFVAIYVPWAQSQKQKKRVE